MTRRRDRLEMLAAIMRAADCRTVTEISDMTGINGKTLRNTIKALHQNALIFRDRNREFTRNGEVVVGSLRDRYTLTESGKVLLAEISDITALLA